MRPCAVHEASKLWKARSSRPSCTLADTIRCPHPGVFLSLGLYTVVIVAGVLCVTSWYSERETKSERERERENNMSMCVGLSSSNTVSRSLSFSLTHTVLGYHALNGSSWLYSHLCILPSASSMLLVAIVVAHTTPASLRWYTKRSACVITRLILDYVPRVFTET